MVSSRATAISDVGLDTADHHLDCEHYPHIRPMALARTWASVGVASWLGNAGRIWMRRSGRGESFLSQRSTADAGMVNPRGPRSGCAPDTNLWIFYVPRAISAPSLLSRRRSNPR